MTQPPAATPPPAPARVVAIDGPSGSGKSSVARAVAARLGYRYLDTGAMYRALTWWCRHQGVDLDDAVSVAATARELPLRMGLEPDRVSVLLDGQEVEPALRESAISQVVSRVATNLDARAELIRRQQEIIAEHADSGIVAEGRDITTVVAPQAPVRILLVADEKARLARRAAQLHGADASADTELLAQTRDEVVRRDADDSAVAQFRSAAPGVVVVDSSTLTLMQTIDRVLHLVEATPGGSERSR